MRHILSLETLDGFVPRSVAEKIALAQIKNSEKSKGLSSAQFVADRVEGKALAVTKTSLDISGTKTVIDILKPPGEEEAT